MATNPAFNFFSSTTEQSLLRNLQQEAIQTYGIDIQYLPRTVVSVDDILNEDTLSTFNIAIPIEVYIKTAENFEGEADLLSKFDLEIRDQVVFTIHKDRFESVVVANDAFSHSRPMEGDCIFFPLNNKIFEIQHVEHEVPFYQLGDRYVFDLRCELFELSNERFETGNTTIDELYDSYLTDSNTAINNLEDFDDLADNEEFQDEANNLLDFTETDPFSEGGRW